MLKDFSSKKIKNPQVAIAALECFSVPKIHWNDANIQLGDTPYFTDEIFSAAIENFTASNIEHFALFCPTDNDGASIGIPNFLHWRQQASGEEQEKIVLVASYMNTKKTFADICIHYDALQKLYNGLFSCLHIPLSFIISEKNIPNMKMVLQVDLEVIDIHTCTQFLEQNDSPSISLQLDITDEKFDRIAYFLDITSHIYCMVSIPDVLGEYTQKKLLQLLQKHSSRLLLQSGSSLTQSMYIPQYATRVHHFLQELDLYFREPFCSQNFIKFYL